MNETSSSNIYQILTTISNIISVYENQQWVKTATPEDIKITFKLGGFVEKCFSNFAEKNCTSQFLDTLKIWSEKNNENLDYSEQFYLKICDHLLMKFFKKKSLNENIIDIAVRMYTSLFPKERLQSVLKNLIMSSASFDAIFDFTLVNKPNINTHSLKHHLILTDWNEEIRRGNKDKIECLISGSLSISKVENSLPILIGILSLNEKSIVSELILNSVLEKMSDRSILSKTFWLSLIKKVDWNILVEVCVSYESFLLSFYNFLIYLGSMMEREEINEKVRWVTNPDASLCPEIDYQELESLFMFMCQFKNCILKSYLLDKLHESQDFTDHSIWNLIRSKCL